MSLSSRTATVLVTIAGTLVAAAILTRKRRKKSSVPHLGSWVPWLGNGKAYLASPAFFCHENFNKLGGSFSTEILGHDWLFIRKREDVRSVVNSSEKHVSMYQAISSQASKFLPLENPNDYSTEEIRAKLSRGSTPTKWDGVAATPAIAASLKPNTLRSWVPGIRQVVKQSFKSLPDKSELDLFEFCRNLITEVTAFTIFGKAVPKEEMDMFVELVKQSGIEKAFDGSMALSTMVELAMYGERQVYVKIRELTYRIIDAEIASVTSDQVERKDDSILTSFLQYWYAKGDHSVQFLQEARKRVANDLILVTFAGITNTFAGAGWTIFHVVRNTAGCGARVRGELVVVPDDSDSLPELEKVLYEIARLYTPGVLTREVARPWTMPSTGEEVQAGTLVGLPIFDIHRDPHAFANPLDFDPERFDVNGRNERASAGSMFLTFGAGTHPCVGRRLAVLEVSLFVSEALKAFDCELVEDAAANADDPRTRAAINIRNHPRLDPSQPHSLWLPVAPVRMRFTRRKADRATD